MDHVEHALVTELEQDSALCLGRADVVGDNAVRAHNVVVYKRAGQRRLFLQVTDNLGCELGTLGFHCRMV
jgi:hypothetical protein